MLILSHSIAFAYSCMLLPRTMITAAVTAENDNVYCRFIKFAVVN